jgi:hypothetical protein
MGLEQMEPIAGFVDEVLRRVKIISDREYEITESLKHGTADKVKHLCHNFPMR